MQMRIHLCFSFGAKQLLHFNNDRTWLGNSCEHICNKERSVSFITTNASFPLWKSHVFQDLKLLQLWVVVTRISPFQFRLPSDVIATSSIFVLNLMSYSGTPAKTK